jgi:predicted dehydrogenase
VTVVGSKRMAVYNDMEEERLRIYDRGVDWTDSATASFERPLSYRYGDIISPHVRLEEPLALEAQHFIDCITSGSIPQTDGWNGLAVVAVLEAISQSLASGSTREVRQPWAPAAPAPH